MYKANLRKRLKRPFPATSLGRVIRSPFLKKMSFRNEERITRVHSEDVLRVNDRKISSNAYTFVEKKGWNIAVIKLRKWLDLSDSCSLRRVFQNFLWKGLLLLVLIGRLASISLNAKAILTTYLSCLCSLRFHLMPLITRTSEACPVGRATLVDSI